MTNSKQPSSSDMLKERAEEIDDILRHLEDYTHGEDGRLITKARRLLIPITEALQSSVIPSMKWNDGSEPPSPIDKKVKPVLGVSEKNRRHIVYYFPARWKTFEAEDWDEIDEDDPMLDFDNNKGICWLKEGWYEDAEQINADYDSAWIPRNIIKWMTLPESPASSSVIPHKQDHSVEANKMVFDTLHNPPLCCHCGTHIRYVIERGIYCPNCQPSQPKVSGDDVTSSKEEKDLEASGEQVSEQLTSD